MKLNPFSDFIEFLTINKRLLFAVLGATVTLGLLQTYVSSNDKECLGIIDSKESAITYENTVLVKKVFVMPGQSVERGQPLIEVEHIDAKNADKQKTATTIRYADEDSIIASVLLKPRERAAPFQPIMSLTPAKANLVYGFIHENRVSEFNIGDEVLIEAITDGSRFTKGKVVSLGKRIIEFPQRFQTAFGARFWGRELIVAIKSDKTLLTGEKVRIRSDRSDFLNMFSLGSSAQANFIANLDNTSQILAGGLELEASGLMILDPKSLLIVSDSKGPNDSPFWRVSLDSNNHLDNLEMRGLKKLEDLESVTSSNGKMYAMSSLSKSKTQKVKAHRNFLVRFKLDDSLEKPVIRIDRSIDLRTPLLEGIKNISLLNSLEDSIDKLEVEAFTMEGGDGFFALKRPQLPDGSSVVLKIKNLEYKIEKNDVDSLDVEVYTLLKLKYEGCIKPSRVTDMVKTKAGLLILSTCTNAENTSQVWWLGDDLPAQQISLLDSINTVLEGMAYDKKTKTLYLASDRGKEKQGSDLMRITISQEL